MLRKSARLGVMRNSVYNHVIEMLINLEYLLYRVINSRFTGKYNL